jgi:hypothetical protein
MRQDRALFFRLTNAVQISMFIGTLITPIIAAWLLGISELLLGDGRALMVAVLIYLGFVIVVLLIIMQLKAETTRGRLVVSKLVGRSSVVDGRLTGISCVVALRNHAARNVRFAMDDIDIILDVNADKNAFRRTTSSVVEPGGEFPFSFQHVSFTTPITVGQKPKVIEGRIAFTVKYRSNSIFQYSFAKVLGFRFIAAPGRAVAFEWKSLGS